MSNLTWVPKSAVLALLLVGAGCASTPLRIAETVGPAPEPATPPLGQLRVYTDTYTPHESEYGPQLREPYAVLDSQGNELGKVASPNSTAEVVSLEPGDYIVRGPGFGNPSVDVPVHIEADRTTEVHLESSAPAVEGQGVVRAPDGTFVGWRAPAARAGHAAPAPAPDEPTP